MMRSSLREEMAIAGVDLSDILAACPLPGLPERELLGGR